MKLAILTAIDAITGMISQHLRASLMQQNETCRWRGEHRENSQQIVNFSHLLASHRQDCSFGVKTKRRGKGEEGTRDFSNIQAMCLLIVKVYYENRNHCSICETMKWNNQSRKTIFNT